MNAGMPMIYSRLVAAVSCFTISCLAVHEPFKVEFESIPPNSIIATIRETVFPWCYMECYKNENCKSIGMEKYIASRSGDCYLLNMIPSDPKVSANNLVRPVVITKKEENSADCSGNLRDECNGTKDTPAISCKDLKKYNPSLKSGFYWIKLNEPTQAYCDMDTSGGGWLMFGSVLSNSKKDPAKLFATNIMSSDITNLKAVESNEFLLSSTGLKELQTYTNFSQIRIFCSKNYHKRVFHVMTNNDLQGKKVVDYFTLKSDDFPPSCNSFTKLDDDTSVLANNCSDWKNGHWSASYISSKDVRCFDHVAHIGGNAHINLIKSYSNLRLECDDIFNFQGFNNYGTWKFFVR